MKSKKELSSLIQCQLCGQKTAQVAHIDKVFGKGDKKVLIENIPVIHCSYCRESYLTDATMRQLDEIRLNAQTLTTPTTVGVAKIA